MIRKVQDSDFNAIADIYNYYIENTIITFEETAVTADEMKARFTKVSDVGYPWLVYEDDGAILGYAYAGEFKSRCSYRFSAETSIYLDINVKGRGIGRKLYAELVEKMKDTNVHALIAGIALPNPESEALQASLGFQKVAHFKEVGFKLNTWIDVSYWQCIFRH